MEKYRTLVPRFCALVLDIILLLPLVIIDELIKSAGLTAPVKWILFFIIGLAETMYYVIMHGFFGQTVGKMLMKVKVLDASSESAIKFRQALLRDLPILLFTVGSFVFFYPQTPDEIEPNSPAYWRNPFLTLILVWSIADLLSTLTNEKRRALHDYLAGTVVVKINQNPEAE